MSLLPGLWLIGMLAPALALAPAGPAPRPPAGLTPTASAPALPDSGAFRTFRDLAAVQHAAEAANQVRIEQRLIIRVAPSVTPRRPLLRDPRRAFAADFASRAGPRFHERRMAQCVPLAGVAGVQPNGGRLILFMRDHRIVAASLEKTCSARDYYSGFLVERTGDGMICAGRDRLLSRSGANCGLGKLHQLVRQDDD